MSLTLQAIVDATAISFRTADGRSPQHISRTGRAYRPGIGPHSENAAMALVLAELRDVLGADFILGMPVSCDSCLLPCDGIEDPLADAEDE